MPTVAALFPTEQELKVLKDMGKTFLDSKLLPKAVDTPEKVVLIMLKGRELDIPPLQALASLHVIDGKVGMASELMLAKIYQKAPGAKIKFVQTDANGCIIEAARPGGEPSKFSFTLKEAQAAGLTNKPNWKFPATMCRWRAISMMARVMFPDILANCYSPDELGAEVDEGGNVLSVPNNIDKGAALKAALNAEPKDIPCEVVPPEVSPPAIQPVQQQVEPEPTPEVEPDFSPDFDATPSNPLDDFVIEVGGKNSAMKGKKFKEVDKAQLLEEAKKMHAWFVANKIVISEKWQQFFTAVEDYTKGGAA
jgi:hypothetical protein